MSHYIDTEPFELSSEFVENIREMNKKRRREKKKYLCGIDYLDIGILESLLANHINSGTYWGVKEHHYKRCKKLVEKLAELYK